MRGLSDLLLFLTTFGMVQAVAGLAAVQAFGRQRGVPDGPRPPVSILKPVCGDEALLEQAIVSFCEQDYPDFQLIIGARDADDPALDVARRVQARFPDLDISILADPTWHGVNRKIGNLINMLPAARHDVLVVADSDLHVRPDYLTHVVAALEQTDTGLVTTIGSGEAAVGGWAARLGAMHMSHIFLPGALLAVALGRQDCLGGTMALRRETLSRIGGLGALVEHVADDNVLGSLVRRLGLRIRIARTLPVLTVQERSLGALWQHELRWARTIRALTPTIFGATVVQYPLFWSLLWVLLSAGDRMALLCFFAAWAVRAMVARGIDDALQAMRARPARHAPAWLLPVRDVLSVAEVVASYWNNKVVWRGHTMRADAGAPLPIVACPLAEVPAAGFLTIE